MEENNKAVETTNEITPMEFKLGLVSQETEIRMRIAELAAQLLQITTPAPGSATMKVFTSIYRELCNEILNTLLEAKEDVVPKV
jgi:hypothetical protein